MRIQYFSPEMNRENKRFKDDKSLLTREKIIENAKSKSQKIEQSKTINGLMEKNENKLLTNDGREIFNENN